MNKIQEENREVRRQGGKDCFFCFLTSLLLFFFASFDIAFAKLSKKQEKKLEELSEITTPAIPIQGKINLPLKGKISFLDHVPETIYLNEEKSESKGIIKLPSKESKKQNISELEAKRNELKQAEEEGLNFIQPSLQLTKEEQLAIDDFFSRNEQEQLLNIWKSTIERNKTIQFIIQKLSPANTTKEGNSLLSKTLGAAIFLPFYAIQAFTDNAGAYFGSQVGGRVLGSVVEGKMRKDQAVQQLSQTEAIVLFMLVDEVAERVRQRYHEYKRLMVERSLATSELEETKKDSLDAQETNSPSTQLLSSIQRRAIEREIRKLDAQIRSHKHALIELAGPVAVNNLEEQLKIELAATQNTPLDF